MDGNFAMEVSRLVTENVVRENFLVELFNVEICEVVDSAFYSKLFKFLISYIVLLFELGI